MLMFISKAQGLQCASQPSSTEKSRISSLAQRDIRSAKLRRNKAGPICRKRGNHSSPRTNHVRNACLSLWARKSRRRFCATAAEEIRRRSAGQGRSNLRFILPKCGTRWFPSHQNRLPARRRATRGLSACVGPYFAP